MLISNDSFPDASFNDSLSSLSSTASLDLATAGYSRCAKAFSVPQPTSTDYIELTYLTVAFLIGAPLNLFALTRLRERARAGGGSAGAGASRLLLLKVHLNVTDLLVIFCYTTSKLCWLLTYEWRGGPILCPLVLYIHSVAFFSSSFIIVCIALDRAGTVFLPGRHSGAGATRTVRVMLVLAWATAFLAAGPQLLVWRAFSPPFGTSPADRRHFTQCITVWAIRRFHAVCDGPEPDYEEISRYPYPLQRAYSIFHAVVMFWLPAAVAIFCYTLILCWVCRNLGRKRLIGGINADDFTSFASKPRGSLAMPGPRYYDTHWHSTHTHEPHRHRFPRPSVTIVDVPKCIGTPSEFRSRAIPNSLAEHAEPEEETTVKNADIVAPTLGTGGGASGSGRPGRATPASANPSRFTHPAHIIRQPKVSAPHLTGTNDAEIWTLERVVEKSGTGPTPWPRGGRISVSAAPGGASGFNSAVGGHSGGILTNSLSGGPHGGHVSSTSHWGGSRCRLNSRALSLARGSDPFVALLKAKRKIFRSTMTIVFAFIAFSAPYNCLFLIDAVDNAAYANIEARLYFLFGLIVFNSVLNPLIYSGVISWKAVNRALRGNKKKGRSDRHTTNKMGTFGTAGTRDGTINPDTVCTPASPQSLWHATKRWSLKLLCFRRTWRPQTPAPPRPPVSCTPPSPVPPVINSKPRTLDAVPRATADNSEASYGTAACSNSVAQQMNKPAISDSRASPTGPLSPYAVTELKIPPVCEPPHANGLLPCAQMSNSDHGFLTDRVKGNDIPRTCSIGCSIVRYNAKEDFL